MLLWCTTRISIWVPFFTLYTIPLSSLISSLLLNRQLYADDTQLFICFQPGSFAENITRQCLQVTITDWMTSNLL